MNDRSEQMQEAGILNKILCPNEHLMEVHTWTEYFVETEIIMKCRHGQMILKEIDATTNFFIQTKIIMKREHVRTKAFIQTEITIKEMNA